MYLNFSNFQGQTTAGGGQALVQKWGQVSDGGIDKFFAGGGPPVPPGKKPCTWKKVKHHIKLQTYKQRDMHVGKSKVKARIIYSNNSMK